jgi:hypothetical protein
MTLSLHRHVSRADTDDGMVLLDERTGRYWNLNPTAGRVVRALLNGATPEDAAAELAGRYPDVSAEQARADVEALLQSLTEARLVKA